MRAALLALLLLLPYATAAAEPYCTPEAGCRFVVRAVTHASPDCVLAGCTPVHAQHCAPTPPRAGCLDAWWMHYDVAVALAGWLEPTAVTCTTDLPHAIVATTPEGCAVQGRHPYDATDCAAHEVKVVAVGKLSGHVAKVVVPLGTCR